MNRALTMFPLVWKQILRSPIRSSLTIAGIGVAMFLFTTVETMRAGVEAATTEQAGDATLIVYRENRFCPFSSRLPQYYGDRIERIDGVRDVVPMQIHVSNCRASLDVVTFRGIPEEDFKTILKGGNQISSGSVADWNRRSDAALVGESLAIRRGIKVGDRFSAAGITVYVAGILSSDQPQDRNVAYVHLPFLQETIIRGGTGGIVTQFNVNVTDPTKMEEVAASIDAEFRHDEHPTTTRSEKAFVGRAARDIVELVSFAGWIGWASLATVLALIGNAIILSMRDRIRDHAVLRHPWMDWTTPGVDGPAGRSNPGFLRWNSWWSRRGTADSLRPFQHDHGRPERRNRFQSDSRNHRHQRCCLPGHSGRRRTRLASCPYRNRPEFQGRLRKIRLCADFHSIMRFETSVAHQAGSS